MNTKLMTAIMTVCFALTTICAQAVNVHAETAPAKTVVKPTWDNEVIVCGDKRVECLPDSTVRISNASGALVTLYAPSNIMNTATKKNDWGGFNVKKAPCKMIRSPKGYSWELERTAFGKTWKAAVQSLEILPDGQLKLKYTYNQLPEGLKLNSAYYCMSVAGSIFEGKKFFYCGEEKTFSPKVKAADYKRNIFSYQLNIDNGQMTFSAKKDEVSYPVFLYFPRVKNYTVRWMTTKAGSVEILIDLRDCRKIAKVSADTRGGIDFQAVEKLEMPDNTHKNIFQNASFEQGLEYYNCYQTNYDRKWDWEPFKVQSQEVYDGNCALLIDANPKTPAFPLEDYRRLQAGVNLTTAGMIVPAGSYTASLYAKCAPGAKANLRVWFPNFHTGSRNAALGKKAIGDFRLTSEWRRYSITFDVKKAQPLPMHINAISHGKINCNVYVDALQLEKGNKATAFEPFPAVGYLLTSDPENFISAKAKIDGMLRITTAKPDINGKVTIRVKNFFGDILLNKQFAFKTNAKKTAELALPLDTLPGLGIFMLRADYTLADGTRSFDMHRYVRVKFLDGAECSRKIFSFDYGNPHISFDFLKKLRRWKKVGVGIKAHNSNFDKEIWDVYQKNGIYLNQASMMSLIRDKKRKLVGFCILDAPKTDSYVKEDDPRILVRDFHHDSDGTLTPAYLEKFKNACKTVAQKYPHVHTWMLRGEMIAKFPADWWSKEGTEEKSAEVHAKLLKAMIDGVRETNPKAKFLQDDPCNMRPDGGIAETDRLLTQTDKLGVKFDIIAIHTYRATPEAPDLDSDTAAMLKVMAKHGYNKTPLLEPEGMHWGPFEIPQWGTQSATWGNPPRTWRHTLLSYDMGKTEKKSASWYARAWLVALKYSDRVYGATAGNTSSNCYMDTVMTPYASQLMPNTLGNLLGNVYFKEDIRFAPFIRAYVFEDAQKRPVAAIWCHMPDVDDGRVKPPVAEADFGNSLEGVFDLMNSPRKFNAGKYSFTVSGFPLFLRGKPGTLKQMCSALKRARLVSGEGISPMGVLVHPANIKQARVTLKNFLSVPFEGTLNGNPVKVPASGTAAVLMDLPMLLKVDSMSMENFDLTLKSKAGATFRYQQSFESIAFKHLPDNTTLDNIDWTKLPHIPFERKTAKTTISGTYRVGWNRKGLYIQAVIKDPKFVHIEFRKPCERWCNDCLQFYIDTMADARIKRHGYDENDYEYAVFPNAKGTNSITYRMRSVEQQLGLATQAPPDNTFAPEIPSRFTHKDGISTYQVFVPAKYLLPLRLEKGTAFGFGLYVADAVAPKKLNGGLTLAIDDRGCHNRPHTWPIVLLTE